MAVAQRVAEEVLATCWQNIACTQAIGVASNADPEQPEVRVDRRHSSRVRYVGNQTAHLRRRAG